MYVCTNIILDIIIIIIITVNITFGKEVKERWKSSSVPEPGVRLTEFIKERMSNDVNGWDAMWRRVDEYTRDQVHGVKGRRRLG